MKQSGFRCRKCGDQIYSNSRHDFVRCSCESIFVDGGFDYLRYGGKDEDLEPISREVERDSLPRYFKPVSKLP